MTPEIDVRHLVKCFGSHRVVDDVSFEVWPGEIFGLLGPNGAGKTTTIRMLTALLPPTSGEMYVGGRNVQTEAPAVRHLLGYVPQTLSADASLTGYENLLIVGKLFRMPGHERAERIQELLHLMKLEAAANQMVREYSGGMMRRLEIAQAILHRPPLLILDEPTVGLDPLARRSVWDALEVLCEHDNMTLLITTHYMEEAADHCQRVAVMHRGQIAACGSPDELVRGLGEPHATLEDVFTRFTGDRLESGGDYHDVKQLRRRISRFG